MVVVYGPMPPFLYGLLSSYCVGEGTAMAKYSWMLVERPVGCRPWMRWRKVGNGVKPLRFQRLGNALLVLNIYNYIYITLRPYILVKMSMLLSKMQENASPTHRLINETQ